MIPILYEKDAVNFENNGIGHLTDTVSFRVKDVRNGHPELTFQYPISGVWYNRITEGSIIKGKANDTSELQLFRIEKSSKPLKGIVTFYAKHISCDLKGIPLRSLSMEQVTPGTALNVGFANAILPHRFTAWSDIATLNNINIKKPRSLRNLCGGEEGSVLSIWGGEFEFDNFTVKLHRNRGSNNGVVINYGKNLIDAKQERNISACYTHFYPYAVKQTENYNEAGEVVGTQEETITLTDGAIELIDPENIGHTKALTLDISDMFSDGEDFSEANLRTHADEYIDAHKLGVPDVNITLSYMQICDSPEYVNIAKFERVALCDTVTVRFLDLGMDAQAKIIETEYDGLTEQFTKIEVGDAKSNLANTVLEIQNAIKRSETAIAGVSRSIAKVEVTTNANAAAVELLVETQEDGKQAVRGSVLVEAINGQSAVKIAADKVNLTGYVTVNSLKKGGSTVIDGSRIQTGQILSKNYSDEYIVIVDNIMNVTYTHDTVNENPYNYEFYSSEVAHFLGYDNLTYFNFTLSSEFINGEYSSIFLYKNLDIVVVSGGTTVSEKTKAVEGNGQIRFSVDAESLLSNNGTSIDLETGLIRSRFFGIGGGSACFSGKINTNKNSKIASWTIDTKLSSSESYTEDNGNQTDWSVAIDHSDLIYNLLIPVGSTMTHSNSKLSATGFTVTLDTGVNYECKFNQNGMTLKDGLGVYKDENGSYSAGIVFAKFTNSNTGKSYRLAVDEETMTVKVILDS